MGFKTLSSEVCETRAGNPIYMETDVKRKLNRIRKRLATEGVSCAILIINEEVGDRLCSQSNENKKEDD